MLEKLQKIKKAVKHNTFLAIMCLEAFTKPSVFQISSIKNNEQLMETEEMHWKNNEKLGKCMQGNALGKHLKS